MDAVLPLIGVVIGAVLGGGMTFLLDRRRERRAARAGLRLVVVELRRIQSTWQNLTNEWDEKPTAETAEWVISEVQGRPFSTAQWQNHQEILASSLSGEDWKALADAYAVIGLVNEAAHTTVDPEHRTELPGVMKETRWRVDMAVDRLQRGTGGPPVGPASA
jgi:hypothetical protein